MKNARCHTMGGGGSGLQGGVEGVFRGFQTPRGWIASAKFL